MEMKYIKSAARLLDKNCVNKGVLDLTETHSTFFERSKPPLLTQFLFKIQVALLMYFISIQSDLLSIVFI